MQIRIWSILFVAILVLAGASIAGAQTPPPIIFFTDITSGPNSGGENVSGFSGAYVTIYGDNFVSSQGSSTITLNGSNCLRVVSWGTSWLWYQKVVVQLGSSCTSGNFVITVSGQASVTSGVQLNGATLNPAAFTVQSGNIRCVSSSGNDSNLGTFAGGCWRTIQHAITTVSSGDIAYIESLTEGDNCPQYNSGNCVLSAGAAGSPKAIVAYPGATVTINTIENSGIRTPLVSGPGPYWVFAGLNITAKNNAFSYVTGNVRIVGNTMACPTGNGYTACGEFEGAQGFVYGNELTIAGVVNAQKEYHGFYFEEGDYHTDFGWNSVHNVRGCRGVQFYSSQGNNMYDLHVHDNLIHDIVCDGINFATVNPNSGPVEAFNNVEYNVGTGPDPSDGASDYACFLIVAAGSPLITVPVQVYNNTCYNAGNTGTSNPSGSGAVSAGIPYVLQNNIFSQSNGQPYMATAFSPCTSIASGSVANDWFGAGAPPNCTGLSSSLNVDPLVTSTSTPNFHLQTASPMIGAGSANKYSTFDHDALVRRSPPSIGAYEYSSGAIQKPNPPTNLKVTVQ
jgi:hypothetical protein